MAESYDVMEPLILNTRTGTYARRGPDIGALYGGREMLAHTGLPKFVPSPNGKWVACVDYDFGGGGGVRWFASALDGSASEQGPLHHYTAGPDVEWLRDSSGFVLVDWLAREPVVFHIDLRRPNRLRSFAFWPGALPKSRYLVSLGRLAGGGRLVMTDYTTVSACGPRDTPGTTSMPIFLVDAKSGRRKVIEYDVVVPAAWTVKEIQVSPDASRICWWLRRRLDGKGNPSPAGSDTQVGVWVSALNGEKMHEVAAHTFPDTARKEDWQWSPDALEWLPDGRSLSYVYGDELYTIGIR